MKPYYQDKWATIYHGNCLEIMPKLEPVDLVLTDPPYGIGYDKRQDEMADSGRVSNKGRWKKYNDNWDIKVDLECFIEIEKISTNQIIWGGQYYDLPSNRKWLIWNKIQRSYQNFSDGEMAWTSFKSGLHIFDMSKIDAYVNKTDGKFHPTQKPVELFIWILKKFAKNTDTILDPFMGSGTTLIAAKQLNRKAIGIEIEEKYCEIAVRRLAQEVMEFK